MEMRTLKRMGFLVIDIDLAKWSELAESDKITFITDKLDLVLSNKNIL